MNLNQSKKSLIKTIYYMYTDTGNFGNQYLFVFSLSPS